MKIFITGGAGFIGHHLAAKYLEQGHEVYIIDNLSTGSINNIDFIYNKCPNAKQSLFFFKGSVFDYEKMLELTGICDQVIHLAAAVGVRYILDNPLESIITNVRATENVLELCSKFKKKVLIASTSEVYGKRNKSDNKALEENDDCIYGPSNKSRWSYAASKLIDEFTARAYYKEKNLQVVTVRFFNTVGPRQTGRYGMVIPRFVNQALKNEDITVYGDGMQSRTFTHVSEATNSVIKLMENKKAVGEVINIGGMEEITILDLAKRIKEMVNSKSKIKLIPYEEAYPSDFEDMQRRVPSVKKLESIINYSPKFNLNGILTDVIESFKEEPIKEKEATKQSQTQYGVC
ncbi:GDP-mannose 4,6-dehydratase [Sulfobacillus acidophilus]|uniref:UDP-glucuronate decarboxylase n=1 Tax=Sulfobacillus acidophilus TaxID=53633 RepID=A0ABS3AZ71_9FIRM|nr:GDP-mannose 4,6-dehydratase [Sulfobacillus acidophilus]